MRDLRNQQIELGQEVYYIYIGKGTFSRHSGVVVGFTPQKVKLEIQYVYGDRTRVETTLKQPEYIIIK